MYYSSLQKLTIKIELDPNLEVESGHNVISEYLIARATRQRESVGYY